MKSMLVRIAIAGVFALMIPACSAREEFGFGVENLTGTMVDNVAINYPGHSIGIGALDSGPGAATYSGLVGRIPDAVEVGWTSQDGVMHAYPVRLKPLPPPTNTSYNGTERQLFFVIQPDNTVIFLNHHPRCTQ